ncbi:MAG TPA: phage Gp37/Gp68 family protein [Reyranella sp.]|nr:phage Gp37/Gp68 family protein [Reyranella sp.]
MSTNSNIEWTDHTFNPWEGCQKVGPGCDNCYAEARNARFGGGQAINWGPGAPRRRTSASNWALPLRWNAQAEAFMAQHGRRQRVFCASLADVFDNAVSNTWRSELLSIIWRTPNLDWLLLTKRIGNVAALMQECMEPGKQWEFPPNVWLGATIVNQAEADRDIPKLLQVPAHVRFLSIEPMLGPIQLGLQCENWSDDIVTDPETGARECCKACDFTGIGNSIDWVIVGGESGPSARPMHPDWARGLRDQCAAAGVPFLFKQWGEWCTSEDMTDKTGDSLYVEDLSRLRVKVVAIDAMGGVSQDANLLADQASATALYRIGKKAAGRLLDGRTHDGAPS